MRPDGKATVVLFAVVFALSSLVLAGGATAQPAGAAAGSLADMRKASDSERGARRKELVAAIQEASPEAASRMLEDLVKAVENRHETQDANFVLNCILALGELKTRDATNVLLAATQEPDIQIAYAAATALGKMWEGAPSGSERLPQINEVLLARSYAQVPGLLAYGCKLAFARINGLGSARAPQSFPPERLAELVDQWVLQKPDALPAPANQPWEILLRRAVITEDPSVREEVLQALLQKRDLGPVEAILGLLDDQAVSEDLRDELADLLGELTGVPFPPQTPEDNSAQRLAAVWRDQWYSELKSRREEKYADYAWAEMERTLARYVYSPSEELSERLQSLRRVLISQLSGPEETPATASSRARALMTPVLKSKKIVAEALGTIQSEEATDYDKARQLERLQEEISKPHGRAVGLELLQPLAQAAADSTNLMFATRLGNVLWYVSEIPLELEHPSEETRREKLSQWAERIRQQKGISLELSD